MKYTLKEKEDEIQAIRQETLLHILGKEQPSPKRRLTLQQESLQLLWFLIRKPDLETSLSDFSNEKKEDFLERVKTYKQWILTVASFWCNQKGLSYQEAAECYWNLPREEVLRNFPASRNQLNSFIDLTRSRLTLQIEVLRAKKVDPFEVVHLNTFFSCKSFLAGKEEIESFSAPITSAEKKQMSRMLVNSMKAYLLPFILKQGRH